MKPIIGIVTRSLKDEQGRSENQVLDLCRTSIIRNGGIPMGIIPTQDLDYYDTKTVDIPELTKQEKEDLVRQIELCDGILLQGGLRWYKYDEFISDYSINNDTEQKFAPLMLFQIL